jgi:catechol 2,3-dioxygenase-like lactoylglutathione lyase family enzyme
MTSLYARTVFFVADAERSRRHYTEHLGFSLDWDSGDGVLQVGLFGFELILNQVDDHTAPRVGQGRVFIGLEDGQSDLFAKHLAEKGIETRRVEWGRPTLVIFFWLPHDDFSKLNS